MGNSSQTTSDDSSVDSNNAAIENDPSTEAFPADGFFSQPKYSDFKYDRTQPAMDQFSRLCEYLGWIHWKGSCPPMEKARQELEETLSPSTQYNTQCSSEESRTALETYRILCQTLPPAPVREITPEECRFIPQTAPAKLVHSRQSEMWTKKSHILKRKRDRAPSHSDVSTASTKEPTGTPLVDEFFSQPQFSKFKYEPSQPVMSEFKRLCAHFHWWGSNPHQKEAREQLKDALVVQFNQSYGEDGESMESWRALCQILQVDPIPETMEECREAVQSIHVNIVDLVDAQRNDLETFVKIFDTVQELAKYTQKSEKYFPLNHAKAGGVLKYLLRHIRQPHLNGKERDNSEPERKKRRG